MAFTVRVEHGHIVMTCTFTGKSRAIGSRRLFDRPTVPPGQAECNVMRPQDDLRYAKCLKRVSNSSEVCRR